MMKSLWIFWLLLPISFCYSFPIEDSLIEFEQARKENKHVLLVFSGSDWCLPCIRLEQEILSQPVFEAFAEKHLVILKADFPQRLKQSSTKIARNEALAERFNPNGIFPKVLLMAADESVISELAYTGLSPEAFIQQINPFLATKPLKEYQQKALLMGCQFGFSLVGQENDALFSQYLEESILEISRLESILSEWIDSSEVSRLNALAGQSPMKVSPELYNLVERSLALSELSQGAFDISFHGLGDLYHFDQQEHILPDSQSVQEALQTVGYEQIILQKDQRIFLQKPGMAIGFGAIGKGFAADQVKEKLVAKGVESGVINASGDLIAWGKRADGSAWRIGIAHPDQPNQILCWLELEDQAIATSGSYEKYFICNDKRYAHIINPKTGFPVSGIKSVSVLSPSAELSDALATAVFVMGLDAGMDLVRQLPGVEALVIDDANQVHSTEGLERLNY